MRDIVFRFKYCVLNEEGAGILEAAVLISVFMVISAYLMNFLSETISFGTTRSDLAASGTGFWRGSDTTNMNNR